MIKKIYDQQIYIYVHILTVDLFFVGFHLESVNLLQFWHLEGSMRLGGLHLKIVNFCIFFLYQLLHLISLLEDRAGLVIQLHTQSREIIWRRQRLYCIWKNLSVCLPLFMEETSGRGPTLSRIESGTTMMLLRLPALTGNTDWSVSVSGQARPRGA